MHPDDERDAARAVCALLISVGLTPSPSLRAQARSHEVQRPRERVERRSTVSAERAFADAPQFDAKTAAANVERALRLSRFNERQLTDFLSKAYGVPAVNLPAFEEVDADVLALIPKEIALRHCVLPVNVASNVIIVVVNDPSNVPTLDAVARYTGFSVEPVVALAHDIIAAIERLYGGGSTA